MMRRRALAAALLLAAAGWLPAGAQAFGRNKVRYHEFKWKVLTTDHFDIHYTAETETLAWEATVVAEKAWQRQIEYFRLIKPPSRRVPIFLYATHHDFIQTNITTETLEEGVGGFTEVFKTRVVLPLGASEKQRHHVIEHELVHAHQFFLLYGEGLRSYSLYKSVLLPLWFMEGMAEHVSEGWDAQGEMVLRDAVLNDRLPSLSLLHSFNHLEPHDSYLGYKAGQSACDYLADQFGDDKIPAILKGIEDAKTFGQVFQDKTGMPFAEFDRKWHVHLREKYWSWSKGRRDASDYGTPVAVGKPGRTVINNAPAASPTEDAIAFLSDRSGYRNLYISRRGKRARALFGNASVDLAGSAPDFSPDGKLIAVVVKDGQRSAIVFADSKSGRIRRRLRFPFLDVGGPRFSPGGESLAFTGFDGKSSEVYLMNLTTSSWCRVTNHGGSASAPTFAPDGIRLVYALETPEGTELRTIDDVREGEPVSRPLIPGRTVSGGHPDISPDGKWVLFDSGENGAPNLYVAALDGSEIRQVTDARTGIWAGRWVRDGKRIAAASIDSGCTNVWLLGDQAVRQAVLAMGFEQPAPAAPAPAAPGTVAPAPPAGPPRSTGPRPVIPPSRLAPPRKTLTLGDTMASRPAEEDEGSFSDGAASTGFALGLALLAPRIGWKPGLPASAVLAAPAGFAPAAAAARRPAAPVAAATAAAVPPTPPAAPLELSARRAGAAVILSWTPPAAERGISRYEVLRASGPGGAPRVIAVLPDASVSLWYDYGWQYEAPYTYRVEARSASGTVLAEGSAGILAHVDVWPSEYRMVFDSRMVDLFVLVGSITIGGGTSFAGYGALQLSDLLGNHRLMIEANAFPSWSNVYGITYIWEGWRPDLAFSFMSSQQHFIIYPSLISTEPRERPPSVLGSLGGGASMSYPFDKYHRAEMSLTAERTSEIFTDRDGEIVHGPKKSTMFPVSVGLVRDTSRWRRLLPVGGMQTRIGASQALPLAGAAMNYTEVNAHTQWYAGLFTDVSLAVRWLGMMSTGPDRRYAYLGGRYYLRAHPFASQVGDTMLVGNHELRMNLFRHLNWSMPLLPMLLTDIQAVAFVDVGGAFDRSTGWSPDRFRAASVGGGINFIGFMLQSSPVMFSIEVARRIDERDVRPTVYGRLGPVF